MQAELSARGVLSCSQVKARVQISLPLLQNHRFRELVKCYVAVFRPHMDDVDRLSRGEGAKRRGTGCHDIPHRLNADERPVYESSKKKAYLAVRGTGYRRERKGNPLPNVYRQWCDAKAMATVVIEQDSAGLAPDVIVVDLSTLRLTEVEAQAAESLCIQAAQGTDTVTHVPYTSRAPDVVPFNIIPAPEYTAAADTSTTSGNKKGSSNIKDKKGSSGRDVGVGDDGDAAVDVGVLLLQTPEERIAAAEVLVKDFQQQAEEAAAEVRRLKAEGWTNTTIPVKEAVARMKELRAGLEKAQNDLELAKMPLTGRAAALFSEFGMPPPSLAATPQPQTEQSSQEASGDTATTSEQHQTTAQHNVEDSVDSVGPQSDSSSSSDYLFASCRVPDESEDHPRFKSAIWALPARPVFFLAERGEAKVFAKSMATLLTPAAIAKAVSTSNKQTAHTTTQSPAGMRG